ncbi:MAG: hypothetical protein WDN49_11375 [Acetobacteraceae bacterium]
METCPVRAFDDWQAVAKRKAGPLFRRISTAGRIGDMALHPDAVRRILAYRVGMAASPPTASSASPRMRCASASSPRPMARACGTGHHAPHAPSRPAHDARLRPARRPGRREPGGMIGL